MKIILGTEGQQPFKIKGGAVSRQHAEVEILDSVDDMDLHQNQRK